MTIEVLGVGFVACVINAILALPTFKLLLNLKIRQTVSQYAPEAHQKKQGTPTMGGLLILPGLAIALLVCRQFEAGVLALAFAFIGFVDDFVVPRRWPDKRGLGWKQKLLMELVAAGAVALWLQDGQANWAAAGITFSILFFANAYNFSDGLDALAGGILLLLVPGFIVLGSILGTPSLSYCGAILLGAILPFLWFNKPPARVFMGDIGSLMIGAVLGLLFYQAYGLSQGPWFNFGMGALAAVMFLELVPVPLQILSVKLTGKRLFLRTPIHHSFEHMGWPESKVLALFLGTQFAMTAIALAAWTIQPPIVSPKLPIQREAQR